MTRYLVWYVYENTMEYHNSEDDNDNVTHDQCGAVCKIRLFTIDKL